MDGAVNDFLLDRKQHTLDLSIINQSIGMDKKDVSNMIQNIIEHIFYIQTRSSIERIRFCLIFIRKLSKKHHIHIINIYENEIHKCLLTKYSDLKTNELKTILHKCIKYRLFKEFDIKNIIFDKLLHSLGLHSNNIITTCEKVNILLSFFNLKEIIIMQLFKKLFDNIKLIKKRMTNKTLNKSREIYFLKLTKCLNYFSNTYQGLFEYHLNKLNETEKRMISNSIFSIITYLPLSTMLMCCIKIYKIKCSFIFEYLTDDIVLKIFDINTYGFGKILNMNYNTFYQVFTHICHSYSIQPLFMNVIIVPDLTNIINNDINITQKILSLLLFCWIYTSNYRVKSALMDKLPRYIFIALKIFGINIGGNNFLWIKRCQYITLYDTINNNNIQYDNENEKKLRYLCDESILKEISSFL